MPANSLGEFKKCKNLARETGLTLPATALCPIKNYYGFIHYAPLTERERVLTID
jgi:hypothetical protein